jgi:hypothetical protein
MSDFNADNEFGDFNEDNQVQLIDLNILLNKYIIKQLGESIWYSKFK